MKASVALLAQSAYYLFTGLWPVIDINSFMWVSGYKTDQWLVKMVGLLTISIAAALFTGYKAAQRSILVLAYSAALSYIVVDVYYVSKGVISRLYLVDAAVEIVIILMLVIGKGKRGVALTNLGN
jgi:hypothetical protein